ncbi:MAG: hypothetical protein ABI615_00835 [Chthoniobacterales bacterium]
MSYSSLEMRILAFLQKDSDESFEELLLEVFDFQRSANGAYTNYCREFPEPETWSAIPAIPQSAFKHFPIRSFPEEETSHTFRTSGTTGEGFGEHHFRSLALYEAAARKGWAGAGLPAKVHIALLPPASEAPHSSLSRMAGWLEPEYFFVREGKLCSEELHAKLDSARAPLTLFGTALAFLHYFEWLQSRAHRLPAGSIAIETGGYKGSGREIAKADLYALFEKHLGLSASSVFNEYGMTELSSQFYSRGLGTPHHCPPWARALVIDPSTGREVEDNETGILKIYDLANLGSACAILTQDLAIRRSNAFELMGRDPAALPRGCSRSADEMLRP